MSTPLTRFECFIPYYVSGTPQDTAIQNFITNMNALTPCVQQVVYVGTVYSYWFVGFLTSQQTSTALGYLNTLNTALGTPIDCNSWTVNSQP
jgi:hypothetical protein